MTARTRWTCLVVAGALLAIHCSRSKPTLSEAENLYREQRYDEAIVVLKDYLLLYPDDPGAHFYLGSSYLLMNDPWLVLAMGELETALALFEQSGKKSPIERFSDTYFELRCHLELAKVLLKQLMFLNDHPASRSISAAILDRCETILAKAREVDPDSPDVRQLEEILTAIRREMSRVIEWTGDRASISSV